MSDYTYLMVHPAVTGIV